MMFEKYFKIGVQKIVKNLLQKRSRKDLALFWTNTNLWLYINIMFVKTSNQSRAIDHNAYQKNRINYSTFKTFQYTAGKEV